MRAVQRLDAAAALKVQMECMHLTCADRPSAALSCLRQDGRAMTCGTCLSAFWGVWCRRPSCIPVSCSMELNLDGLLVRMWDMMALVSSCKAPKDLHPGCKHCQGQRVPLPREGVEHTKMHKCFAQDAAAECDGSRS